MRIRIFLLTIICTLIGAAYAGAQGQGGRVTITGTVVDNNGEPLPGAFVLVTGTTDGTSTDADGKFSINAQAGSVLEIQFLGYETKKVTVPKDRRNISVALMPDKNLTLNESVTIAYGSVRKQDLTGSVTNVKMGDIKDAPVLSVDQALQGRIAGADIMTTSGEPGASTSIRIRGTRSIIASNEPLIVVDGVMDAVSDLGDLNSADIESISVLKDASSTAIYGSRGSNGVIIVTTKRGDSDKPRIVFKAEAGVSQLPKKLDVMKGYEYAQYRNDIAYFTTGNTDAVEGAPLSKYPYKDPLSYGDGTDWLGSVTRTAVYQNYNLSVSGGNKKSSYYMSFGYNDTEGKGMISKYPRLVRDAEGSSIYTYTNTTCPYRRDGVRLPYGSGTLSGVIVHELFPNYVYGDNDDEELSGNIGRYQIRHQSYSDIAFDKENSFSHILAEFRYATGFRTGENGMSYFNATDGQASARFFHTSGDAVTNCPSTFNYIGWTGTNSGVAPFKGHIGFDSSIDQPLGYSFADGYVFDYSGTNSDGKGKVSSTKKNTYNGVSVKLYDGWMSKIWWKDEDAPAESWIVEFSTKDIAAQHLSMQFTSYSAITSNVGNAPYNWTVSWSDTFDLNDESVWKKVADYVVPDGVLNGQEREWQLPAFKQYDFVLPLEMLGKDKVYLRLRPASRVSNTLYFGEGTVTDGTQSGNGIDYFAIRYN